MDIHELNETLRREGAYRTARRRRRWLRYLPGAAPLRFYGGWLWHMFRTGFACMGGGFTWQDIGERAGRATLAVEDVGGMLDLRGIGHLAGPEPVVVVSNHMSTFETAMLLYLVHLHRPVSFVLKQSLMDYPVFGQIMRTINAIPVTRQDPRQDLKQVLDEAPRRLADGISVVIFPQATRSRGFDPEQFNSLGVKVAGRAGVAVVPCAVRTDFWETGRLIRDFGPLHPERTVRCEFGPPIPVENRKAAQQQVVNFIRPRLDRWMAEEE